MSQSIARVWFHVSLRRKKQGFLLVIIMILAAFAEVVSIGAILPFLSALTAPEKLFHHALVQPVVSSFKLNHPQQVLLPLTLLFILATIFAATARLLLLWFQTRLGHAIGADFSIEMYKRTLYQPYEVHLSRNSSKLISGIVGKSSAVVYHGVLPLLTIISSILMLLLILAALFMIDLWLSLVTLIGFSSIYLLIILATKKNLINNSRKVSRNSDQVIKALQEGLGGIRDVLIDGTQMTYCSLYRSADASLHRAQSNSLIIGGAPRFLIEALGMSLIAVVAYSISAGESDLSEVIPILGVLALGAQRLLPIMQQLYQSWSKLRSGRDSLNDALDLIGQPLPSYLNEPAPSPISFRNAIRLNHINFRYSDQAADVLTNVNLEIKKGSCVGIMGTTGSGKSTLLDVVMGLLPPKCGTLEVDGIPITNKNLRAWQIHVAHVPQAIFLADISIAENIAFGVPQEKIDMQRVRHSARLAQIAEVIESLEKGYQTPVGERGVKLSGGQRQRIGIARALYKQADVIVFDEATSALDSRTESSVMDAIGSMRGNITILMVSHRLSTLSKCDQIVELQAGCLIFSEVKMSDLGSEAILSDSRTRN